MTSPAPLIIKLACGLTVELTPSVCPERVCCRIRLAPRPHQHGIGDVLVDAWADMHRCRTHTTGDGDPWVLWIESTAIDLDGVEQAQQAERWLQQFRASLGERLLAAQQRIRQEMAA